MGKITNKIQNSMLRKYFLDSRIFIGRHFITEMARREREYWNDVSTSVVMTISDFKRNARGFDSKSVVEIDCNDFMKSGEPANLLGYKFKRFDQSPNRMKFYPIFSRNISNCVPMSGSIKFLDSEKDVLSSHTNLGIVGIVCRFNILPPFLASARSVLWRQI